MTLAGCGQASAPPATAKEARPAGSLVPAFVPPPDLRDVDPQQVFAKLTPTDQLAAAADQLATALAVPPETVRARLQPSGCTLCDAQHTQGIAGIAGIDVATAAEMARPGDGVYLFVGQFTCYYIYRSQSSQFTPQSCQLAPL
jgi:hypothetical protein